MLRLLCVLSHVYSQLRYSWPGIPDCRPGEMDDLRQDFSADIFSFSPDDWSGLIERLTEVYPVKLPWLGSWCREHDPGGRRLSANIARHLDLVKNECAHYITYDDERYPESLRFIPDPPLAITLSGKTESLNKPCVSVIGSRKASAFALQESFQLAKTLAGLGYLIISGGAFGCDIAAHQGALASMVLPVPTICVSAGGLARLYPVHNQHVFDRIRLGGGVILTERLWWEGCRPRDFAARNRIISGLSFATCVMQAAMKSGALLTARHSLNHGREVLVLRHPEYDVRADGNRWLQDDGAVAFSSAAELCLNLAGMQNSQKLS